VIKYALLIGVLLLAFRALLDMGVRLPWGGNSVFIPPDAPASDITEIATGLRRIELALSRLSLDSERTRVKVEEEARRNAEFVAKFGVLETRVEKDSVRAQEAEAASREAAASAVKSFKKDLDALKAWVQTLPTAGSDDTKAMEERVRSLEVARDALEATKKNSGSSVGSAWWSKSGKPGLTIKSSDGQDVTAVIADFVSRAVAMYGQDTRPDFALHSSGASVYPSLTSPTYEIHPSTLRGKLVGSITGNGFGIGLPPVMALHYDIHDGRCWPFAGSQGQLGVILAAPVYIEDFAISHVASAVTFNMRTSAPREMEVWAMVEGLDNIAKLKAWRADKAQRRENGESIEDEPVRPKTIPKSPEYIRIATFRYDLHADSNIQTFPIDQEIKALGIDFGIVVLMVKSNWGMNEFTCLYRFQVHGQMKGASAAVYPEELNP
jgi:SUN domain-containing protein 1/2